MVKRSALISAVALMSATGDHDLLVLKRHQHIAIFTAADTLRFIDAESAKK